MFSIFAMFDFIKVLLKTVNPLVWIIAILGFLLGWYYFITIPNLKTNCNNLEKLNFELKNAIQIQNNSILQNKTDYETNIKDYNSAIISINDDFSQKLKKIKNEKIIVVDKNITTKQAQECDAAFNYIVKGN